MDTENKNALAEQDSANADKIAADKAKAEKAAADKIAADKAKADKVAADKVKAEKANADKAATDKAKAEADAAKVKPALIKSLFAQTESDVIYENTSGEFFTQLDLAVHSEGGKSDNVTTHIKTIA